jgi:hypothetical protein
MAFGAESSEAADLSCAGRLAPLPKLVNEDCLFDSGGTWRVDCTREPEGLRLVLRAGPHPGRAYQLLEFEAGLTRAQAWLDTDQRKADGERFFLCEPALELWISFLLMRARGAVVHGCGLLDRAGVRIFAGVSGAGKSTIAGVFAANGYGQVLSDDRLVLRPEGHNYRVWGTPWHGEARFAAPEHGPLRSVYFLRHAEGCSLCALTPADAAGRLAACVFMAGWPREGVQNLVDLCVQVASAVPCFELGFCPDESVIELLQGLEH